MAVIRNCKASLFFISFVSFLMVGLSSCGTAKEVNWSDEHLVIKSAYVQKYVPGQEGEKVVSYLFIDLEKPDSTVVLEEVSYHGHRVSISAVKIPLRIDWEQGAVQEDDIPESNQAVIYYSKGKKHFKHRIDNIQKKEDLFLP